MKKSREKYLIGIDEVGRGPLAGPVVVAALMLPRNFRNTSGLKLRDSKKLTALQRHGWSEYIKSHPKIHFAISKCFRGVIDKINISNAANLAATKALKKLLATSHRGFSPACRQAGTRVNIFLDGGLYVNVKTLVASGHTLNPRTIIRGDEKIPAISLASIVAKVTRDRLMKKLHKKYPRYDFINNVGYGTKRHIKAIRKFGLSPIHRRSFTAKFID